MAKTTASASGTNRNFATPVRKNMGTNTMQMHSVETSAGMAISCEPSRIARTRVLALRQVSIDIFDRHGGVVHQNADGQRQAAQRHQVDGFVQRAQHGDGDQNREREWRSR